MTNAEDLHRLLSRLHTDSERAWEEYEELQQKLIAFFDHNGCGAEAEELADEVLDRIARKPESFEIISIGKYAHKVASNVLREHWRRKKRHTSLDADKFPGKSSNVEAGIIEGIYNKEKNQRFIDIMRRLTGEERELLLKYYPSESEGLEECRQ